MKNFEFVPVFTIEENYYAHVCNWLYLEEHKKLVVFMDRLSAQYKVQKFYIVFRGVSSCSFSRSEYIEESKVLDKNSGNHVLFKKATRSDSALSEFITFKVPHLSSLTILAESFQVVGEGGVPCPPVPHYM